MASMRGFRALLAVLELQFQPLDTIAGIAAFTQGYLLRSCSGWRGDPSPVVAGSTEQFYDQLWQTAVDRLHEQAHAIGADGVIGVGVTEGPLDVGWQLQLIGTAFRLRSLAEHLATPFISALPLGDFLTLLAAGWVPSGLAWGNAAVHVHGPAMSPSWQGVQWQNAEMAEATDAVNTARARAESDVRSTLRKGHAEGAVGMTVNITRHAQACYGNRNQSSTGMLVRAQALGTGVVRYRDTALDIMPSRRLSVERAQ